MSLNTSSFMNSTSKTPLQKLVDGVVNSVTSGLQLSVSTVSQDISQTLFNAGVSYDSVAAISAKKTDAAVAAGSADYHMAGGVSPERASASDVASQRAASNMNGAKFSTDRSPSGVIDNSEASGFAGDIYPPELHNSDYYIQFNFKKYHRPAPFANPELDNTYSVVLPIPADLKEMYGVDYNTGEQLGMVGDIMNAFQRQIDGVKDSTIIVPELLSKGLKDGPQFVAEALGFGDAGGSLTTVIQQFLNIAPNPNITVAFQGPRLRDSHQFSWIFAPKTPEESEKLRKIIITIKNKMLPRSTFQKNAAVLSYPDMVQIELFPEVSYKDEKGDTIKGPLYKYKLCVITNVNVDYSINGIPSFFKGTKLPTMIRLSISAQEIEYFLSEDESFAAAAPDLQGNLKEFGDFAVSQGSTAMEPPKT
jgi:hypothetical protein